MRTIAEYEQQHRTVCCIHEQAHFFEGECESVIEYLRNCTINGNCDVDKPKRKFNCSLETALQKCPVTHISAYMCIFFSQYHASSGFSSLCPFSCFSSTFFISFFHLVGCVCATFYFVSRPRMLRLTVAMTDLILHSLP